MKSRMLAAASVALALLCVPASGQVSRAEPPGHHGHHRAGQGIISLDVYRDGTAIHLLSGEQRGEQMSLWHRRSDDGGVTWSAPVRVDGADAPPRPARRGDDAQIAARGDTVLALWSVPGTGWGGSGPLRAAISRDGGKTWSGAASPSDSGSTAGEAFVDLLADAKEIHAVWLDARDKAQGLRYSHTADGMKWAPNVTVAQGTCECCWNSLLLQGGRLHVLFRASDPRDMELATRNSSGWKRQGSVGAFRWRVKGCPETGGGLALGGDGAVNALVWTGLQGKAGLYALRSRAGADWSKPKRLGGTDAQHGDIAANGSRLAAVWDEGGAIMASTSPDGGRTWRPASKIAQGPGAANPRLVAAGEGFLALWTQIGADEIVVLETSRVR